MKNQNGVTLIALVGTILILLILASITITTSIQSYKQMRFETFKAELNEVQLKVDEICEDFKIFKKENGTTATYSDYFTEKFGSAPTLFDESDTTQVEDLLTSHNEFLNHTGFVFYFNQDDMNKYLGLKGIDELILIDFSTRYVYSIEGCKDPDKDLDKVYYTAIDFGETTIVDYSEDDGYISINTSSTETKTEIIKVGSTNMAQATISFYTQGIISKVYYNNSNDGSDVWIEVKDYEYIENGFWDDIKFILYEEGDYIFKLECSEGATANTSTFTVTFE